MPQIITKTKVSSIVIDIIKSIKGQNVAVIDATELAKLDLLSAYALPRLYKRLYVQLFKEYSAPLTLTKTGISKCRTVADLVAKAYACFQ